MKNAIVALILSLFAVSANAGLNNPTRADAKTIIREVMKKNLVGDAFNETFKGVLKNSKNERLTDFKCDAILAGGYMCTLSFFSRWDDSYESSFDLEVTIRKSQVESALITNLAG